MISMHILIWDFDQFSNSYGLTALMYFFGLWAGFVLIDYFFGFESTLEHAALTSAIISAFIVGGWVITEIVIPQHFQSRELVFIGYFFVMWSMLMMIAYIHGFKSTVRRAALRHAIYSILLVGALYVF